MALTQYKQGSTYYGYDPSNQQGIAFSNPQEFNKYFGSFDQNAQAPNFDVSKLMATPNQLLSLAPPPQTSPSPTPISTPSQTPNSPLASPTYTSTPYTPPTLPDISGLENQYKTLLSPTADETQAQTDLNNLQSSYKMGATNIEGKPIALEFQTGQLSNLEKRYNDSLMPLQQRLALLQSQRQSALDASKFALSRADEQISNIKNDSRYAYEQTQQNSKDTYQSKLDQYNQQQKTQEGYINEVRQGANITSPFYKNPGSSQVYDSKTGEALSYEQYKARGGAGSPGMSAFPDVQELNSSNTATKFETITLGSGKTAQKIRVGYDASGNIVSRTNIATGQKLGTGSNIGTSPTSSGTTGKVSLTQGTNYADQYLTPKRGTDGYVSPEDYTKARNAWVADKLPVSTFDSEFGKYINPSHPQDYPGSKVKATTGRSL